MTSCAIDFDAATIIHYFTKISFGSIVEVN